MVWIRSQDGESLVLVTGKIHIVQRDKVFIILHHPSHKPKWEHDCLGTFPTLKAALAALDDIQKAISGHREKT